MSQVNREYLSVNLLSGGCHCGNLSIDIELPRDPGSYRPRVCDCDFCREHNAAYVSDAEGSLRIRIKNARALATYRQGSEMAEFLLCNQCGVLVAVLYRHADGVYAAANTKAIDASVVFGSDLRVSPKALSAGEKTHRWRELWFSKVECATQTG
jgi:hypothetical protein